MAGFQDALAHQVSGDSAPLLELWSRADDVAILGAIGTYARGWEAVRTHLLGASQRLNWTGLSIERVVTTVAGELAMTVNLEHMTRQVDGAPDARTLRATQVYRRENGEWRLILRHANPITDEDRAIERTLQEDGSRS